MAESIENSILENRGNVDHKPYRNQYRGLKGKLSAPNQHQFRVDLFTGVSLYLSFPSVFI